MFAGGRRPASLMRVPKHPMSIKEAAQKFSISRFTTYSLIVEGKLLTIHIGRRRLVRTDSVRAVALCISSVGEKAAAIYGFTGILTPSKLICSQAFNSPTIPAAAFILRFAKKLVLRSTLI